MSHIVTIDVQLKDTAALEAACRRLKLPLKRNVKSKMFDGEVEGNAINLPGWTYPVVVTKDGKVKYDNYNGRWGDVKELNKLRKTYSIEAVKRLSRGRNVVHRQLKNGSVQLTIT